MKYLWIYNCRTKCVFNVCQLISLTYNVLTLLSMSNIVLKFPVHEMETGNFTVSIWSGIIPEFRFTQQMSGSFPLKKNIKNWKDNIASNN